MCTGMGIIDGNLPYCHDVSEGNMARKISTLEYSSRTVYECFNNFFTDDFSSPALNLPPMIFDDTPHPHKRARYTPYLISAAIYISLGNYFSTLTTPYDFPDILPSDNPNSIRVMNIYVPVLDRVHRG